MSKYMYLYNGPATDMEDMSEDEGAAIMAKWQDWMKNVGPALIDVGSPLAKGTAVVDDGSTKQALLVTGYSIVEAENLEAAKQLCADHPFLSDKTGDFSIEIFEITPIEM